MLCVVVPMMFWLRVLDTSLIVLTILYAPQRLDSRFLLSSQSQSTKRSLWLWFKIRNKSGQSILKMYTSGVSTIAWISNLALLFEIFVTSKKMFVYFPVHHFIISSGALTSLTGKTRRTFLFPTLNVYDCLVGKTGWASHRNQQASTRPPPALDAPWHETI